ncbi:lovastatin nonaketide synthase [Penicillium lividum]|nr:lovastatin nonaketide synthase [Penicillium lividum]
MDSRGSEPIAIVGSGCRFPGGSSSPARLWELLSQPRDVSSNVPEDRFNGQSFYHPDGAHHGTTNTRRGYFLEEGIRHFDTKFFNIPPSEADTIDPQQRLLLEVIYEAIESAGMTLQGMQGTQTGVFVGMMGCEYEWCLLEDLETIPTYMGTGVERSMHANRVSHFFDWHGPSMSVDTACSSSMMAVYLAVQALRNGDASVAIAAGASLIFRPENFIALSNMNMVAPDGRSKMWDAEADGYARGEGVGVVVLKPLSAALKDGDHIECVIREICVNQDGRTQGITVPNGIAQATLIRQTYQRAGLDLNCALDRPQYFEAHGTGTPAGDFQEAQAICRAFFEADDAASNETPLYVGSIKTVIGHTEGAAGIASILKASLALQHESIPPNQHFKSLSPSVAPFAKNLKVPTALLPWPKSANGVPKRASVNSFGFGGTNAHVILETFESVSHSLDHERYLPISLSPLNFSAPSEQSLNSILSRMAEYLRQFPETNMRDLAYTLQVRRSVFPFRKTFWAPTCSQLSQKIFEELERSKANNNSAIGLRALSESKKKVLAVFTGQGAQWIGMGKELIVNLPYAGEILDQLQENLDTLPDGDKPSWSLRDQLLAKPETSGMKEPAISQPLITSLQIILVCLLRQAGIEFTAVVGHSSGEIGAAYAAGFITAADAIRNSYYRGLFAKLAGGPNGEEGGMLAAGISFDEANELCSHPDYMGRVMVAASNSPVSVTLSGDIDAIARLKCHLDETSRFCRPLRVEAGFHSHHMLPIAPPYVQALESCGVQVMTPEGHHPLWWSSVHPSLMPVQRTNDLNIEYWKDNMMQSVLFNQAVENAVASAGPFDIAIEIGPHPALRGPFLQTLNALSEKEIPYLGCLTRGKDGLEAFSETLGSLWSHLGPSAVDFDAYERKVAPENANRTFVSGLPSYPWTYDRPYWFQSRVSRDKCHRTGVVHSLLGVDAGDKSETQAKWRNFLRFKEIPWLEHHQIHGQPIFPTTAYMCMAWEAALKISDGRPIQLFELHNVKIGHGILLDDIPAGVEVIFALSDIKESSSTPDTMRARFSCHSCTSRQNDVLVLNAEGEITVTYGMPSASELPAMNAHVSNLVATDTEAFYSALSRVGYGYSGDFKSMVSLKRKRNRSRGVMRRVPTGDLLIHPATLDTAFQAVLAAISYPGDGALWSVYTPVSVRHVAFNPYFAVTGGDCDGDGDGDDNWAFDSTLMSAGTVHSEGTVQVYPQGSSNAAFQLEGITAKPSRPMNEADDRKLFSKMALTPLSLDADLTSEMVHRLSYRFPRMDIMEIGSDTGAITENILQNIVLPFASLIYTDLSRTFLNSAQKTPVDISSKIEYRALDLETDFVAQGFQEHSLDLIIVSNVLYTTGSIEGTLSRLRSLLRPGGHLILSEMANSSPIEDDFLVDAFPGLGAGFKDLQLTPMVNSMQWDELLRKSNFSGVDVITPTNDPLLVPLIMISQAVDPRVEFLREPLFCSDPYIGPADNLGDLLIVGSRSLYSLKLAQRLSMILLAKFRHISTVCSLHAVAQLSRPIPPNIVFLGDLDQPTFNSITETELNGLKRMTSAACNILWLTFGSQGSEPYNKMSIGFGRSLMYEIPDMHLQFLDFDELQAIDALYVAQRLLILCTVSNWAETGQLKGLVWTSEPEIYLQGGKEYIPRVVHDSSRNTRYNTRQRTVTQTVNSSVTPVHLEVRDASYLLSEKSQIPLSSQTMITIEVLMSSLSPVRLHSVCSAYITYGLIKGTSEAVIVPTLENASILHVPRRDLIHAGTQTPIGDHLLETVVWEIIALQLLEELSHSGTILLYQPPQALLPILNRILLWTTIEVVEIAHTPSSSPLIKQVIIPPRMMAYHIKEVLPTQLLLFADFSTDGCSDDFSSRVRAILPHGCKKIRSSDFFGGEAKINIFHDADSKKIHFDLTRALSEAMKVQATEQPGLSMIRESPENCSKQIPGSTAQFIVDWAANSDVVVQVQPATDHVTFHAHKTYLLVGLTGDLGQSLCEWMISRGARVIVLVSRQPRVEQSWLDAQQRKGAFVHVYST